jgi:hypothetical protein
LSLVRPLNGNFPTISYLNLSELLALVPAGLHGGKKTPYCYSLPENGPPVSREAAGIVSGKTNNTIEAGGNNFMLDT